MEVIAERAVSLNPVSQDLESRRARQLLPPDDVAEAGAIERGGGGRLCRRR